MSDFLNEGGIDPNHRIVMDYLRNNLNDPDGLEVIAWTQSEKYKTGNIALNLKYRAKNPLGTKTIHYDRFWIRNGKVIESFEERFLHVTPDQDTSDGRIWLLGAFPIQEKERQLQGKSAKTKGSGDLRTDPEAYDRASKEFWGK